MTRTIGPRAIGPIAMLALLAARELPAQRLPDGSPIPGGDPTLAFAEGRYHIFSSGPLLPIFQSDDLLTWHRTGTAFDRLPPWADEAVPENRGYVWAPDIATIDGEYRLYWSTSTIGSRRSAIGWASNRTLDPASPDYRWVDRGKVIATTPRDDWNAIDPQCFEDRDGRVWLVMGSYWSGIKMHRLDRKTGALADEDRTLHALARRTDVRPPAIEGAYLIWRDPFYYLFVSFDRCHLGASSNYNIRVGRSPAVTGPYADRAGRPMLDSGATPVLESQGATRGPGHNSVLQLGARTWIAFHYFDPDRNGRRTLQIRPLSWDAEGWPHPGQPISAPR